MHCYAHRGFAAVNPENTVPAVRAAFAAGADGVEVDVRRCGSGELVVCHDPTVDRVTDGTGRVDALTLDSLDTLDVQGSGAGVPPLSAVLEAVPAGGRLNVELKERSLAADLAAVLGDTTADVIVSSFDPGALTDVAAPTALLVGHPGDSPDAEARSSAVLRAADLGCRAIHPNHGWCSPAFVRRAQEAGFTVNAWTVRTSSVAERLAAAGVDGIIADYPACCA